MTPPDISRPDSSGLVPVDKLIEQVLSYHSSADADVLRRAYQFANEAHARQVRKSGAPYFSHPTAVAQILADFHLDAACVCAALLHDVLEDTSATVSDIEQLFGIEIASLVDGQCRAQCVTTSHSPNPIFTNPFTPASSAQTSDGPN